MVGELTVRGAVQDEGKRGGWRADEVDGRGESTTKRVPVVVVVIQVGPCSLTAG